MQCSRGIKLGRRGAFGTLAMEGDLSVENVVDMLQDHLSRVPRFAGAAGDYSVAQHSALCSSLMGALYVYRGTKSWSATDYKLLLHALLHDAHEAFLGDIVSPVLSMLPLSAQDGIDRLKGEMDELVLSMLGVPRGFEDEERRRVRRVDRIALYVEKLWFFGGDVMWGEYADAAIEGCTSWEKQCIMNYVNGHPFLPGTFGLFLRSDLKALSRIRERE